MLLYAFEDAKRQAYKTVIFSVVLYGCERWSVCVWKRSGQENIQVWDGWNKCALWGVT